jgi:hypothetical protein
MHPHLRPALAWVVFISLLVLSVATDSRAANETTENAPTLIFITKSDACDCVRSTCVAGEQEVLNFMAGNRYGFRLEKIDLATDPKAGKTYRAVTLPVAILRDAQGQEAGRFASFFTAKQLHTAWDKHLKGKRAGP